MSRREDIETAIWSDPDFHALSPLAQHVYIWSFTNSRTGMAGIYTIPKDTIAHETKVPESDLDAILAELEAAKFLFYDGTWLWVRSRVKRLRTRTVQMCQAVAKQVARVPADHPYRVMLVEQDGAHVWSSGGHATTLLGELGEGPGGYQGPTPDSALQSQNPSPSPVPPRWHYGKGSGKGRGKGLGVGGSGGKGTTWREWAAENVPDLPADFAALAAGTLASSRGEVTPEKVRQRVLAQHPHLSEETAA